MSLLLLSTPLCLSLPLSVRTVPLSSVPLPVPARARALALALALVHTHGLPVSVRYFLSLFVALVCALACVRFLSRVCAHARAFVHVRVLPVSVGHLLSAGCLCQSLAVLPHRVHAVQRAVLCGYCGSCERVGVVVPFFLCISATIFVAAEVGRRESLSRW